MSCIVLANKNTNPQTFSVRLNSYNLPFCSISNLTDKFIYSLKTLTNSIDCYTVAKTLHD